MIKKVINGKVECGDTARDKVTKIEGVVVVRHDYLFGVLRIGIQPPGSHSGKEHEAVHLDIYQAELLQKNTVSREGTLAKAKVELGDICKDRISGFSGLCTGMAEWLYSCTKVLISPRKTLNKETGEPIKSFWFDEPQVKTMGASRLKPKLKEKTTGGFDKPTASCALNSDKSFNHS